MSDGLRGAAPFRLVECVMDGDVMRCKVVLQPTPEWVDIDLTVRDVVELHASAPVPEPEWREVECPVGFFPRLDSRELAYGQPRTHVPVGEPTDDELAWHVGRARALDDPPSYLLSLRSLVAGHEDACAVLPLPAFARHYRLVMQHVSRELGL